MQHLSPSKCSILIALILTVCPWPTKAQDACLSRKVPVYFRDSQNLPVQNIPLADLEAKVRGRPVKIVSLTPDTRRHRILLLLDTSGSMGSTAGESPLWKLELTLAQHFVQVNQEKTQIALLTFSDKVENVTGFSAGNSVVSSALKRLADDSGYTKIHVKGHTALWDSIFRAVQLLDHPSSADAVYLLTDGGDNASRHTMNELLRYLEVTSVRVFAVLLYSNTTRRYPAPEELSGPGDLADLTQRTGGEILSAAESTPYGIALSADPMGKVKSQEMLSRLYQAILQDSILEIELSSHIAKNERFEVRTIGAKRALWKGLQLTYPTTLIACDAEISSEGRR